MLILENYPAVLYLYFVVGYMFIGCIVAYYLCVLFVKEVELPVLWPLFPFGEPHIKQSFSGRSAQFVGLVAVILFGWISYQLFLQDPFSLLFIVLGGLLFTRYLFRKTIP